MLLLLFNLGGVEFEGYTSPYGESGLSFSTNISFYREKVLFAYSELTMKIYKDRFYETRDSILNLYTGVVYEILPWINLKGYIETVTSNTFYYVEGVNFFSNYYRPGIGIKLGTENIGIEKESSYEFSSGDIVAGYRENSKYSFYVSLPWIKLSIGTKKYYDTYNTSVDSIFGGIDTIDLSLGKIRLYGRIKKCRAEKNTSYEFSTTAYDNANIYIYYPFENADITFCTSLHLLDKNYKFIPSNNFSSDSSLFSVDLRYFLTKNSDINIYFVRAKTSYTPEDTAMLEKKDRKYIKVKFDRYFTIGNICFTKAFGYGEIIYPFKGKRMDRKKGADTTSLYLFLNKPNIVELYSRFLLTFNKLIYTEKYPQGISWHKRYTLSDNRISFFLKKARIGCSVNLSSSLTEYPLVKYLNDFTRRIKDSLGISLTPFGKTVEIGTGVINDHSENWGIGHKEVFELLKTTEELYGVLWCELNFEWMNIHISGNKGIRIEKSEETTRLEIKSFKIGSGIKWKTLYLSQEFYLVGGEGEKYTASNFFIRCDF